MKNFESLKAFWFKIRLSDDEYAAIDAEWQEQLALREELKEKPIELKRYEKKLRDATF